MSDAFWYTRIQVSGHSWQGPWAAASSGVVAELAAVDHEVWGTFSGLFGLASNELVVISHGPAGSSAATWTSVPGRIVEAREMVATARPVDPITPLERSGLYVLRTFDLTPDVVDEVVTLSSEAWETFEVADQYQSVPVGLFTSAVPGAAVDQMLLVTWYDGFGSWVTSRAPDPASRERFVRRRDLTQGTNAVATSLLLPD